MAEVLQEVGEQSRVSAKELQYINSDGEQKESEEKVKWKGVENFLILRSNTDTALKNNQHVLNALNLIANFRGTD